MRVNYILETLIEECNKYDATVMVFKIVHEVKNDYIPMAVIEDNEGRLITMYYINNEWR